MSGRIGGLSPQQEEALSSFREAVTDVDNKPDDSDHYYLRWLRARKFDVSKAEQMFRNHMEVRLKYSLDTILEDWTPPEVMTKFYPGGFFGEDRDGHPVWYDSIGRVDLRGLYHSVRREDFVKCKLMQLEKRARLTREFSERKGRLIKTVTLVLDFEGLTVHKALYWPGLELVREIIQLTETHFPETSKTTLIIRAPAIFPMLFGIVKPMMAEKTLQKINVLGRNWQEELQRYISPENLPQVYGGTRCEPDPWCSDYINPGSDIPREYYLANLTEHKKENMQKIVIGRGRVHPVTVEVTSAQSLLKWEFVSVDYNIGFGIYCEVDGKRQEVLSVMRKESHVIPESGAHICEGIGTYFLHFDNSYSWTRSKELFYSVQVIPPGSLESAATSHSTSQSETIATETSNTLSNVESISERSLEPYLKLPSQPEISLSVDTPMTTGQSGLSATGNGEITN